VPAAAGCGALADLVAQLAAAPPSTGPVGGGGVEQAAHSVVAAAGSPEADRVVSELLRNVDDGAVAARCAAPP
jgi:hypothetical protein